MWGGCILNSGLYHLFKHHEYLSIIPYVTSIMANSVDPDKTLQIVAYVQGLVFKQGFVSKYLKKRKCTTDIP